MQPFLLILAITVILIYIFRENIKNKITPKEEKYYTLDDQFNAEKKAREDEINRLLGKMGANGIDDLSEKDKALLEELSKK